MDCELEHKSHVAQQIGVGQTEVQECAQQAQSYSSFVRGCRGDEECANPTPVAGGFLPFIKRGPEAHVTRNIFWPGNVRAKKILTLNTPWTPSW